MEEVALDSLGAGLEAEKEQTPPAPWYSSLDQSFRALALWDLSVWQSSSALLSSELLGNLRWAPKFIFFIQTYMSVFRDLRRGKPRK